MLPDDFKSRFFEHETPDDHSDITIIRIQETHLTEEQNTEEFGVELLAPVDQYHCRRIVLNVDRVEYATSSVIGKIIMLHRKLVRGDGRLILCCVRDSLLEVLKTSRLDDYFEIVDDEPTAVERLK